MSSLPPLTRRMFVGGSVALGALPSSLSARRTDRLLAGTYANEGGPGLVPLIAGPKGWSADKPLTTIRNASFGVRAGTSGAFYLVDEQEKGAVGIYDRDLRHLGTASTLGADPCHAALGPDGRMLAVANYSSGSIALWSIDPATGLPRGEAQHVTHSGSGPNRERQAAPHAHWVGFANGGRLLHAVDLGADAIFAHTVDPRAGRVTKSAVAFHAAPGSGPRHLARHPRLPVAYLVAELLNAVTVLTARADGSFTEKAVVSTLPKGFSGASAAAHIAVNRAGTRLYVSNRGHDSIAVFAIGGDGGLEPIQHAGCGGHWPRLFLPVEDRGELLVANQRSGNVARLSLGRDGRLGTAARGVAVPGVAFLTSHRN